MKTVNDDQESTVQFLSGSHSTESDEGEEQLQCKYIIIYNDYCLLFMCIQLICFPQLKLAS